MVGVRDELGADRLAFDDLTRRAPGQSAMARCVAEQRRMGPRSSIASIFGRPVLNADARFWYLAALAERISGRVLDALEVEHVVLHSIPGVPIGVGIDPAVDLSAPAGIGHVVVGPMGVVVIATKRCPDQRVVVSDDHRRHAELAALTAEARAAAARVAAVLSSRTMPAVPVRSVVAVVGAAQVVVADGSEVEPVITEVRRLAHVVARMPAALGHEAVWQTAAALRSASTWSEAALPDDHAALESFAVLDRAVRIARLVRVAWALALCSGIAVAAVVVAESMPSLL